MSRFSSAFQAVATDPFGEAMQAKLYLRLNDGEDGIPGTLVEITDTQEVLSLSALEQKREYAFGVVQGQAWQVGITNIDLEFSPADLVGCWLAIKCGFPDEDEWDLFAQGKIARATPNTDEMITIEVHDSVMDLLNVVLPRDICFQLAGWISTMKPSKVASGSGGWLDTQAITLNTPASADDETFIVEFTTSTDFKVILEDGDETQTGTVAGDCMIDNVAADSGIITIPSAGWDGTQAIKDRYVFYTSDARTSGNLTPVGLILNILTGILDVSVYDVISGANYSSPLYDILGPWLNLNAEYNTCEIGGEWEKGTPYIELIQDALKIIHGTIFPTHTGQIGIWALSPSTTIGTTINGNPDAGTVSIISGIEDDSLDLMTNEVEFKYLSLSGDAATITKTDSDTPYFKTQSKVVNIGWRVESAYVDTAAARYLYRFKCGRKEYTWRTTLSGLLAEMGTAVMISEPMFRLNSQKMDLQSLSIDALNNVVELKTYIDRVVQDGGADDGGTGDGGGDDVIVDVGFFILGSATSDPVGNRLGAEGAAGAAPIW